MIVNPTYIKRLKYLASCNDDVLPESTSSDQQIDYVEISDVFLSDGIKKSTAYKFGDAPSRARRIIKKDDVLISTVRTYLRAIASVKAKDHGKIASTGFAVLRPHSIHPKYFSFACLSEHFIGEIISKSVGVSYPAINASEIMNVALYVPRLETQRQIAAYLNRETAKIDKLIAKQQKLIKLLQEKRQAVISQAVTKGLDPNVKMKDSGVEWLGIVPENWTLGKLRNVAKIVRGASPRPAGDPKLFSAELHENGLPWVTVAEITKDEDIYLSSTSSFLTADGVRQSQIFKAGTFLFTNSGATLGVPKILDIDCCANDGVLAFLNITEKLNPLYLYFYLGTLTSTLREELKQGGGQPNLNTDLVKQIPFVYPSYEVQSQILAFLKEHLDKLRDIKVSCEKNMQLLKEYKQALITAAVTGKIDVRGLVTDEEVAALDADPVLETTEEDFESEVAEADYITEEE